MRLIFFCFMTVFGITACHQSVTPPNQLSLDCYIRVLESEGRIRAEATMLSIPSKGQPAAGSSALPVEIPGGIRYQGSPMTTIPTSGLTYFKDFPGTYVPEHIFSWDDSEKKRHTFTLKMNQITNFTFGSKTIPLSQPARFTWEGGSMEKGETLVLMWENQKENLTVPMELIVQGQLPQIDFPVAKLKDLSPGTWTLYIVRKKLVKTDVSGVASKAILEFYSKTDTLTLTR